MVQIREAKIEDSERLLKYLAKLLSEPDHCSPSLPGEFQRSLSEQRKILQTFQDEPNSIYLIAEDDSQIIGELNLKGYQRLALKHGTFLGMSVNREHRKQGIGKALLEYALNWAKATQLIERVELAVLASNESAIKLYHSNGFVEEGRRKRMVKIGDYYIDDILMVKILQ